MDRTNAVRFAEQPSRVEWDGGDAARGARLYRKSCWVCHGADGGGHGPGAASLNPKPRDFRTGRFYIDANADDRTGDPIDLARVILVGAGPFGGNEAMQGWHETHSTQDVRHLVAYVRSLGSAR